MYLRWPYPLGASGPSAELRISARSPEGRFQPDRPAGEGVSFATFVILATLIIAVALPAGMGVEPYNVYTQQGSGIGSTGDCVGAGSTLALAQDDHALSRSPAAVGQGGHCLAGNGAEPPANNADNGSPDWPPGESYDVNIVWVDGKPVWVVQGADGHAGIFDNHDDAVVYASQHAEPAGAQQGAQPPAEPPAQPPAQPPAEPPAQPPAEPTPGEITVEYVEDPSPPVTPQLQAWMTASWLVEVSKDRPLTATEQAELAAALAAMNPNSPNKQMLINQYQQNVAAQQQTQATQQASQPQPQTTPTGQTPTGQPTPVPSGKQNLTQYYQNQYGSNTLSNFINSLTGNTPPTEPVLPHSGEFVYDQTPLHIPGRGLDYMFRLSYHSQLVYDGPAGWGWEHNNDRRVIATGGGSLGRWDGAGHSTSLSFDGVSFTPPAGLYTAVVSATTGITLTGPAGVVEGFFPLNGSSSAGRLRSISDRNGNTLRFAYDAQGRLQTVTDTLGRPITYTYDANSRLAAVTDFAGRAVRLTTTLTATWWASPRRL